MEELAEKILDLLREEKLTIGKARLVLERAIKILDFEKLQPKKETGAKE